MCGEIAENMINWRFMNVGIIHIDFGDHWANLTNSEFMGFVTHNTNCRHYIKRCGHLCLQVIVDSKSTVVCGGLCCNCSHRKGCEICKERAVTD